MHKYSRGVARRWGLGLALLAVLGVSAACSKPPGAPSSAKMSALGQGLAKDAAEVRGARDPGAGAPVIVLEESHDSRLQRIEEALVLLRAYRSQGLRQIVLEAYVQDRPPIPFEQLHHSIPQPERALMAVGRLERGEINAAEMMATIFEDVKLVRSETRANYRSPNDRAVGMVLLTAIAVGAEELPESDQKEVLRLLQEADKDGTPAKQEAAFRKVRELASSKSPVIRKVLDMLLDPNAMVIEDELAQMAELRQEAQKKEAPSEMTGAIDDFVGFLKARSEASATMVQAMHGLGLQDGCVAMVIGAGHTQRVEKLLGEMDHPYVVLRPTSFGHEDPSKLPPDAYQRRFEGKPMREKEISGDIWQAIQMMEEPSSEHDWHRAESELYGLMCMAAGGGAGVPRPPSDPKSWFNGPDGWKGRFWSVDKNAIAWLDANGAIIATQAERDKVQQWDKDTGWPQRAECILIDAVLDARQGKKTYSIKLRRGQECLIREDVAALRRDLTAQLEQKLVEARERLRKKSDPYRCSRVREQIYQLTATPGLQVVIGTDRTQVIAEKF